MEAFICPRDFVFLDSEVESVSILLVYYSSCPKECCGAKREGKNLSSSVRRRKYPDLDVVFTAHTATTVRHCRVQRDGLCYQDDQADFLWLGKRAKGKRKLDRGPYDTVLSTDYGVHRMSESNGVPVSKQVRYDYIASKYCLQNTGIIGTIPTTLFAQLPDC